MTRCSTPAECVDFDRVACADLARLSMHQRRLWLKCNELTMRLDQEPCDFADTPISDFNRRSYQVCLALLVF